MLILKVKTSTREVGIGSGRPFRRLEEQSRTEIVVV